jgi:hypothetical protein
MMDEEPDEHFCQLMDAFIDQAITLVNGNNAQNVSMALLHAG